MRAGGGKAGVSLQSGATEERAHPPSPERVGLEPKRLRGKDYKYINIFGYKPKRGARRNAAKAESHYTTFYAEAPRKGKAADLKSAAPLPGQEKPGRAIALSSRPAIR